MNYFDLHCDTIGEMLENPNGEFACGKKAPEFEKYHQCFALFVSDQYQGSVAKEKGEALYDLYNEKKQTFEEKGITPYLTLENCEVFGGKLESVEKWKSRTAVMATLTWNGENSLAHGAHCKSGGLKPFGKAAVRQMEKLGIVPDVSHLNFESFRELCSFTDFPFAASHSCCFEICQNSRNLKDSQIKEIICRKGLLGICFYPVFLGNGDVFEKIYEHLFHVLSLGGEDILAFGSDFDGAKMKRKLKNIGKVPHLYSFLEKKGFDNELLEKIFFKNAENFFNRVLQA
ncbi:MAG: dipeptidase [Acutalibacteraceae bacterium]